VVRVVHHIDEQRDGAHLGLGGRSSVTAVTESDGKNLGKHRENMGKTWENVWNMEIYGKFDGKYIWKKPENQKPTKLGLCTGFHSLSYLQAGCDHGTVVCVGG